MFQSETTPLLATPSLPSFTQGSKLAGAPKQTMSASTTSKTLVDDALPPSKAASHTKDETLAPAPLARSSVLRLSGLSKPVQLILFVAAGAEQSASWLVRGEKLDVEALGGGWYRAQATADAQGDQLELALVL